MFVVDASVWVARFLPSDVHHITARRWTVEVMYRGMRMLGPSITLPEVAGAMARRTGHRRAADAAVSELTTLPWLSLITVDMELAQLSAEFAASLRLKGADATYVAAAVIQDATLVTLDRQLLERSAAVVSSSEPWDVFDL